MKSIKLTLGILTITIVLTLVSGLSPCVRAGGGETIISYYDVDNLEAKTPDLFPELDLTKPASFIFKAPDGSQLASDANCYYDFELYFTGVSQLGKYTLTSYPIPEGYESVGVFCESSIVESDGFTTTQGELNYLREELERTGYEYSYYYLHSIKIYVRKTDATLAGPVTLRCNGSGGQGKRVISR